MTAATPGANPAFQSGDGFNLGAEILRRTAEIHELYRADSIPWVIGYSGGKDSTAILQLIWWALRKLPPEERTKTVYVITTDTLVESPVVSSWVERSLTQMKAKAREQGLPIEPHLLRPEVKDTFWVNLIGKGYPAPRHKFRWCTERLKIKPSNRFIRQVVRSSGEAILVLGSRKSESAKRARALSKHGKKAVRDRLSPNSKLPNSLIYTPIEDWTNDDVWLYLMQVPNAWGHSNRDLLTMYRGASADNECPLVVDTSTPSCGQSRFGCWVCTMVDKDKSMEAMIQNDDEKEWMEPLLRIRNFLDVHEDKHRRDFRRLHGRVQLFQGKEGEVRPIYGPYTKEFRERILKMVLETQRDVREEAPAGMEDIELIRLEELREIRRIWLEEKHEFDDALPRIYREVTGKDFDAGAVDHGGLGPDEYEVLEEVCADNPLVFELAAHLLHTEQQYRTMARRVGLFKDLEATLSKRGFESEEEAVQEAHLRKQIRDALNEGTIDQQLDLMRSLGHGDEVSP